MLNIDDGQIVTGSEAPNLDQETEVLIIGRVEELNRRLETPDPTDS